MTGDAAVEQRPIRWQPVAIGKEAIARPFQGRIEGRLPSLTALLNPDQFLADDASRA